MIRTLQFKDAVNTYNQQFSLLPQFLKKNQFCKKIIKRSYELKGKDEVVIFINQNLSNFVPIITAFPNITLIGKCLR